MGPVFNMYNRSFYSTEPPFLTQGRTPAEHWLCWYPIVVGLLIWFPYYNRCALRRSGTRQLLSDPALRVPSDCTDNHLQCPGYLCVRYANDFPA